jgi:2-methylisocitrate lyase-like PEP mutase family enzyme
MREIASVHPLIAQHRILVVPGVYDVLSAKIAERAGFHSVVLTGYGFAAAHLGEPDFGLFTQTEILDCARRITAAVQIGVVVDGDTGHGGPLNVQRMVRELVRMGARGIILEDQRWPKRCGHMRGKEVIDADEHAQKIRAAKEAKGDAPFIVTARTDAVMTHGLDEALRRARLYKEAGADVLFVEGPRSKEEIARVGKELPPPLAINLIEGGDTPLLPLEELEALGFFSVGFVLSGLYAAAHALERTYREIRARGSADALRGEMMDFSEFAAVVGLEQRYADDTRFKV